MILVTGASGFIGSHLVERLAAQGESVRCLVHRTPLPERAGVASVRGDLATGAGLDAALEGVSTVIHLAGVTKALTEREYYAGNAGAAEHLSRALRGRGIRLVHVSTLAAIRPGAAGAPVKEDAEPAPLTHYGRSKLAAERIVRAELPDAVIVRPSVVYGPRDTDLFQLIRGIRQGFMVQIAGGERWFSAIYVEDVVDGLLAAASSPRAPGRSYFLTHAEIVSWTEFGGIVQQIIGRQARVLSLPVPLAYAVGTAAEGWAWLARKPGIISRQKVTEALCEYWTCSSARATAELGFTARTPMRDGLALTLPWYREAGWLTY